MAKHNSVQFTGNLVGDIKPSTTSGGKPVSYGRLAVDLLGPENVKTGTLWLGLTAYGQGAAQLAAFARGTRVVIEGKLDAPSVYMDAQGMPQVSLRVVTFAVTAAPLPVKPETAPAPSPEQTAAVAAASALVAADHSSDDADDLLAEYDAMTAQMTAQAIQATPATAEDRFLAAPAPPAPAAVKRARRATKAAA
ncbi:MAG TPA: single-stranded DNA-binding protein [Chloroflexota bacterium]|nr:single-stranded DNA-binding protein [Chloroflexota bacterium]